MLATSELVRAVAASLREHRLPGYVLDPVMMATSGDRLLDAGAQKTIVDELLPLATLVTPNLLEAGLDASIGTVGDALDNALMESTIGLYKTELIKPRGPWKNLSGVELATAEYVDWYNHRRLHSGAADLPPADFETLHQPTEPRLAEATSQPT